jgi:microcin C transport system permease protein
MTELTKQRFAKFRRNKPAWFSFVVLIAAYLLSLTSPWLVNDKPLFLKYNGKFYFSEVNGGVTYVHMRMSGISV